MRYVAVSLPFSSFSSFMFIIVSLPFSSFNCSSCYHFRVKRNRFFHLCIFEREIINENILTTADELKGSFFVINDRTGSRGVGGWIPAVFFSLAQTPPPPQGSFACSSVVTILLKTIITIEKCVFYLSTMAPIQRAWTRSGGMICRAVSNDSAYGGTPQPR